LGPGLLPRAPAWKMHIVQPEFTRETDYKAISWYVSFDPQKLKSNILPTSLSWIL
jgi:hypothetical protein